MFRYYSDLCMKAVNQSIGRSIRHVGDYASILLLDDRYCQDSIKSQLPSWIRGSTRDALDFGTVMRSLAGGCSRGLVAALTSVYLTAHCLARLMCLGLVVVCTGFFRLHAARGAPGSAV